jgi:hypothetical protein
VVLASEPVLALPLAGLFPDQPPEAVQPLALVADHTSSADPPLLTLVGLALTKMLGPRDPPPGDPCPPLVVLAVGGGLLPVMLSSQPLSSAFSAQQSATATMAPGRAVRKSAGRIEYVRNRRVAIDGNRQVRI